jgi:hypothetical protein
MTAPHMIDPSRMLGQALSHASPDLTRHLLSTVINALLSADAHAVCGAEYGVPSPERVNHRNGYRHRELDTRADTIDVAVPKLRTGSYFPEWLLERRKRAEARWSAWSQPATCSASRRGGWTSWCTARGSHRCRVAGPTDGRRPRRAGGRVPYPPVGTSRGRSRSWPPTR